MEDGVKEEPAQSKELKFLGKAGWVKKAHGRVLTSYKDRYIHVEKTELVVYENEDLQNCLERLDLENYDKCHELKSPFTKKHRLIVIRSPKSANKVHDLKFQVTTAEEKESWIKALTDAINRAKNKVFDEVTVDESSNLEHVTRTRPKGNRNRRPPTRIHMKEVADVSSDGILRLDLDLEDAVMPNGTHYTNVDGTENHKEATASTLLSTVSEAAEEQSEPSAKQEPQTEPEISPQKKVIKPPMPPTKEAKLSSSVPDDEPDKNDGPEKKVLKPPMPPSKEAKPSTSSTEETTEGANAEISEKSPDVKKKTGPPPTPPNKPNSQPTPHPPAPPSKNKKPHHPAANLGQGTANENEEEDNRNETTGAAKESDHSASKEAIDKDDKIPQLNIQVSEEETGETFSSVSNNESPILPEPLRESNSPPIEGQDFTTPLKTASDSVGSSLQAEEALPKIEAPSVVVSSNDPFSDNLILSHLPGENKKKAEEKSVDSGQHSDDDSEGSGSEDLLAASTAALRGSHTGLDILEASEDNVEVSVNRRPTQATSKQQVLSKVCRRSVPIPPAKPSAKVRSASIGDLLSDSSTCIQVSKHTSPGAGSNRPPSDEVMKLETEVALEIEKTSELLSRVSQSPGGGDGEAMPEDLLAKALEKLKTADHVLKEVKKLKCTKNLNNRKSW